MDSACRILRLRRVALATSFVSAAVRSPKSFLCNRNEVSYYIKKPYLKSPLRYGTRWKYTAEPALQGMEYPAGILIYSICSARADQMQTHS